MKAPLQRLLGSLEQVASFIRTHDRLTMDIVRVHHSGAPPAGPESTLLTLVSHLPVASRMLVPLRTSTSRAAGQRPPLRQSDSGMRPRPRIVTGPGVGESGSQRNASSVAPRGLRGLSVQVPTEDSRRDFNGSIHNVPPPGATTRRPAGDEEPEKRQGGMFSLPLLVVVFVIVVISRLQLWKLDVGCKQLLCFT